MVGEYDDKTGDIRWQRVVLANQKVVIQGYLHRHYPPRGENQTKIEAPTTTTTSTPKEARKKSAAA